MSENVNKVSREEFETRLGWTLEQKIDHSLGVIDQALSFSNNKAYVSFSGGKDSTALLHLARIIKPDIKGVFFNTTNEYPEIYRFVRNTENVVIVNNPYTIKDVIEKVGFPLISKEQALYIRQYRSTKSDKLRTLRRDGRNGQGKISKKWMHMVEAPFDTSERCCYWLKKRPAHRYERKTKELPIVGTMASESSLRKQKYLMSGCNAFDNNRPQSMPLSIWTTEDVWNYIRKNNVPYCDIYDKGLDRTGCMVCGFGCQFDDRFSELKTMYPIAYKNAMAMTNKGITYEDAIKYTLRNEKARTRRSETIQGTLPL